VDDFIRRLCLRLAQPTPERPGVPPSIVAVAEASAHCSRRGFLGTMGKVAVGAAAVVAGTAFATQSTEAAGALHCCEGRACSFRGCYEGMALGYTWSCAGYFCHDCFTDYGRGDYFCTYTVPRRHTTVHRTAAHRTTSHHAASHHASAATTYSGYGGGGDGGYGGYAPPPGYFGWS
jgi:hypothetical protein